MKISEVVKNLRASSKMTLDDLSESSHLSKGFLSRLENGDFNPNNVALETIIKLAGGLNVTVKDILDSLSVIDAGEPPPLNVYLRKKYKIKNEQDIATIQNIVSRLSN